MLPRQNCLTGEEKPESQEKDHQRTSNQNPDGGGKSELDSQENNQQPTSNQNPDDGGKSELDSQENNQQPTMLPGQNCLTGEEKPESQERDYEPAFLSSSPLFWRFFRRIRCKPVKTEYFACIGSSVTLKWDVRSEVDRVLAIEWQCPNSTERGTITGRYSSLVICMNEESAGEYICKVPGCSGVITLSILQPREQQAFVNDDVTFDATNCTTNKEYKWTYINCDNNETDIKPDRRYVVVNNEDTRKLTITGYRKEDNGIYVCRDKKTDEQLTAHRLKTKNNLKVVLTFMESPEDEEFKQNLIYSTEQLLRTLPDRVVKIRTHEEPMEPNSKKIQIVAYLNRRQNKTDLEERMKFNQACVCILFLADHMSQPTIPLDRNHITISFRKYSNTVKCSFYDDSQKDTWNKLLKEFTED